MKKILLMLCGCSYLFSVESDAIVTNTTTDLLPPATAEAEAQPISQDPIITISNFTSQMPEHTPGHNVHVLDTYITNHMSQLLNAARMLNFGDPSLTKEQIIAKIRQYTPVSLSFSDSSTPPVKTTYNRDAINTHITLCLTTAWTNQDLQELSSRLISLAEPDNYLFLIESISENYATRGGCFEGVRNRLAIVFGVTLYQLYT